MVKRPDNLFFLRAPAYAAASLIVVAGVLKSTDLNTFLLTLNSWQTLPKWLVAVAAPVVPFLEIVLGGCFLLGIGRRAVAVGLSLLVATMTLVFLNEYAHNPEASCGCFGKWSTRAMSLERPWVKALTNGALIMTWILYLRIGGRQPRAAGRNAQVAERANAFTLIEVLLSIVIVGVLVAIALPAMSGARASAKQARTLADLHTHSLAFQSYANDSRGTYPHFLSSASEFTDLSVEGLPAPIPARYFNAAHFWHLVMAERYYSVRYHSDVFQPPNSPREALGGDRLYSGYLYPCAFVALPDYWDNERYRRPPAQWQATQDSMVTFPAAKVMVLSKWIPGNSRGPATASFQAASPLGFVDGSSACVVPADLTSAFHRHGGTARDVASDDHPGMHTIRGVAGRDRR